MNFEQAIELLRRGSSMEYESAFAWLSNDAFRYRETLQQMAGDTAEPWRARLAAIELLGDAIDQDQTDRSDLVSLLRKLRQDTQESLNVRETAAYTLAEVSPREIRDEGQRFILRHWDYFFEERPSLAELQRKGWAVPPSYYNNEG